MTVRIVSLMTITHCRLIVLAEIKTQNLMLGKKNAITEGMDAMLRKANAMAVSTNSNEVTMKVKMNYCKDGFNDRQDKRCVIKFWAKRMLLRLLC